MSDATVNQITDALPGDIVCERLGVKPRSIRLARERGVFPASWYKPMQMICAEYGVDCPDNLFNWKSPSSDTAQNGAA